MQTILTQTAIKNGVYPHFLKFIGIQDESETMGKKIYHFNIMDKDHPRFKSTVTFMVAV